ncbi:energy transducer TonB [Dyella monticola]|uniref:Energy transducer TonB n=1 Tax=Dyella monticola TaxID=1927958 RepID=A0A370X362_9GAMM|nr:energy transducer TonB [Dyella monticola]RDS82828.1 energy transducer TonB [Dyella monticola]
MSSASLAVVRRAHPDMVRVTALSAAISLNLAALVFALRPLAPKIADVFASARPTTIDFVEPPPLPHPPPDIVVKPFTKPVPAPAPVHIPITQVQHVVAPIDTTSPIIEPSHDAKPVVAPPSNVAPPSVAPGVVSLTYRSSPLKFPIQAMRMHMQGTVLLRVLVDENGKPIDVVIEHGSGYPLLDKSAREQVLASWQFQAAVIDGHAVKAWARVPVTFALQEM